MAFWGAAAALFLVIIFAKIPAAGTTLVLLMFGAMLTRTVFQWVAFATLQSTAQNRRAIAVNGIIWLMMTSAFFVFVIVHQFRNQL